MLREEAGRDRAPRSRAGDIDQAGRAARVDHHAGSVRLQEGDVDVRPRGFVDPRVLHVPHHANHPTPFVRRESDALPERLRRTSPEPPGHRLVDDRHRRCRRIVATLELAPGEHANLQRPEVVGCHRVPQEGELLVLTGHIAVYRHCLGVGVHQRERRVGGEGNRFDGRIGAEAVEKLLVEHASARLVVAVRPEVDPYREDIVGVEPHVSCPGGAQAFRDETGRTRSSIETATCDTTSALRKRPFAAPLGEMSSFTTAIRSRRVARSAGTSPTATALMQAASTEKPTTSRSTVTLRNRRPGAACETVAKRIGPRS